MNEQPQPFISVPPAPKSDPQTSSVRSSKKTWLRIVAVVVILTAVASGIYYWQQQKVNRLETSQSQLKTQKATLVNQLKDSETTIKDLTAKATEPDGSDGTGNDTPSTTLEVIPGQVDQVNYPGYVYVNTHYLPGTVGEIWLEYGTSPTALMEKSKRVTQGLGEGQANVYAEQDWKLDKSLFKSGGTYYYRVGYVKNGTTAYSGVTAFSVAK